MNSSTFAIFFKVLYRVVRLSGAFASEKTSMQKSGTSVFNMSAMIFCSSAFALPKKSLTITNRFSAKKGSAWRFVPNDFGSSSLPSMFSMFMSPPCFFSNWSFQNFIF